MRILNSRVAHPAFAIALTLTRLLQRYFQQAPPAPQTRRPINPQASPLGMRFAAVDCGVAIDPDVVAAQVEGAIGFALAIPLRNQITFKEGLVEQSNFDDYEPARMREMPDVEVHIVKSTERPTRIGEPGVPPVAPAVGNAIAAASRKRLRSLPFDLASLASSPSALESPSTS